MFTKMTLLAEVEQALNILNCSGFEAYVVGGCVRDHLMGIQPHDYDICTSAEPNEILKVFDQYKTIETGIKHGTVTVVIDQTPLEITTFRTESKYSDSRHPDMVNFVRCFKEDAARRDFTMNAIGYSPETDFLDFFDGITDIRNKIIRAVGNPEERFQEDALRILRALRFSSMTGFTIEKNTETAIHKLAHEINKVSPERIYIEFTKLICGDYAAPVIDRYFNVISLILPELTAMRGFDQKNPHHIYDVLGHTLKTLEAIPNDPILRWTMLFHDAGKPHCFNVDENGIGHFYRHAHISFEFANQAFRRLHASNAVIDRVTNLIRHHDTPIEMNSTIIKKRIASLGKETFFDLIQVMRADCMGLSPEFHYRLDKYEKIKEIAEGLLSKPQCFTIRDLKINGEILINNGISPGPNMGKILNILLNEVLDEKINNDNEVLLQRALEIARTL